MGVAIRSARPTDSEAWQDLFESVAAEGRWIGAEPPVAGFAPALFERHLGDGHSAFFVVDADETLVGWITAEVDEATGSAELGMGISANHRGQGIGTAMMQAVVDWARSRGIERLWLEVFPHNAAAIALYERFSFVETGRRVGAWPRRDGQRWDLVTMERRSQLDRAV